MAVIQSGDSANISARIEAVTNALKTRLFGATSALDQVKGGVVTNTTSFLPVGGVNDASFRPLRVDRTGALASNRITQLVSMVLYGAAIPPQWLSNVSGMVNATTMLSGIQLNSTNILTSATSSTVAHITAMPKAQKSPINCRFRLKLTKGNTGSIGDWGLSSVQAPGTLANPNGFSFLYGVDGTLKPTYYFNAAVAQQGTDISSLISTTQYYVYDILVDDDQVTFTVQDPTTGAIINEQSLPIAIGNSRIGQTSYFFVYTRVYNASLVLTQATQIYLSDATAFITDTDLNIPYGHLQGILGLGSQLQPTSLVGSVGLSNYVNSTIPASATLSNTTAGYTTLGGQFQFVAVVGAETDYLLFSYQIPSGLDFVCTGVTIDTLNTGAAVATTPTALQWYLVTESPAVTLATTAHGALSLGGQTLPIGAAPGTFANQIGRQFQSGIVVHSGRFFQVVLKMPVATATASQIIRGNVGIEGYYK